MFHAFVIVCAASFNMEIDQSRCLSIEDAWGPYRTEENCMIRANQIVEDVGEDEMKLGITAMLGYPPMIYAEGRCTQSEDVPA